MAYLDEQSDSQTDTEMSEDELSNFSDAECSSVVQDPMSTLSHANRAFV